MKGMKGLTMKSMLGSVRRGRSPGSSSTAPAVPALDTPEANATRNVRLFCESGSPNNPGEEVLFLPTIVESAESSPIAARECAQELRKFLTNSKENASRPHVQYNAIMLIGILAGNPGKTFTRNMDKKFVETVKDLLRTGQDPSVNQILMETLADFEKEKKNDENLAPLIQMWEKERGKMEKAYGSSAFPGGPRAVNTPPFNQRDQDYFLRHHTTNRPLPTPQELSSRIEEARTSAKLLTQLCQSTPPAEFFQNDLIREFADRCLSASRSIQGYISTQNPAPDNDTMLTLIETNEQLALAMSKHQRAILMTRKTLGLSPENGTSQSNSPDAESAFVPPPGPPPSHTKPPGPTSIDAKPPVMPPRKPAPTTAKPPVVDTQAEHHTRYRNPRPTSVEQLEDPFKDPATSTNQRAASTEDNNAPADEYFERLGVEPYHPGFNPSQSYMGRQDSAVGKLTMHAAVPATPEVEQVEKEAVLQDHSLDEDTYNASPVHRKAPIYRY